jgi:integrase
VAKTKAEKAPRAKGRLPTSKSDRESPEKLRLKAPGWRNGRFAIRVGNPTLKTYERWRHIIQDAIRTPGCRIVLDAVADGELTLAEVGNLHVRSGLDGVVARIHEIRAAEEAAKAAVAETGSFVEWLEEYRTDLPHLHRGTRGSSEETHIENVRDCERFLDFIVDRHTLHGGGEVKPEHRRLVLPENWTRANGAGYVASYVKTHHGKARAALKAKWAKVADAPSPEEQRDALRRDIEKKANTASRHMAAISGVSTWLIDNGRITENPAVGNRRSAKREQTGRKDSRRGLTRKELSGVLLFAREMDAENEPRPRGPDAEWVEFLAATGATTYTEGNRVRPADLSNDRNGKTRLKFRGSKSAGRDRSVWIGRDLADRLRKRSPHGRAIFSVSETQGIKYWKRLLEFIEQKAPGLHARILTTTPYTLRHTYAKLNIRAGVDVRVLQRWMGHEDLATTARYLDGEDPPPRILDRAVRALSG